MPALLLHIPPSASVHTSVSLQDQLPAGGGTAMRCAGNRQAPAGGSLTAADALASSLQTALVCADTLCCPPESQEPSTPVTGEEQSLCQRSLPAVTLPSQWTFLALSRAAFQGTLIQCQVLVAPFQRHAPCFLLPHRCARDEGSSPGCSSWPPGTWSQGTALVPVLQLLWLGLHPVPG